MADKNHPPLEVSTSQMDVESSAPPKNAAPAGGLSGSLAVVPNPAKRFKSNQATVEYVPRYLILKRDDGIDFSKISPFVIGKVLHGLIGECSAVRKISGGLLIECSSDRQANRLKEVRKFGDFNVTVTPHATLNYVKGVVTCPDLLNCSIEEIVDGMKDQGVVDARRITVRRDGVASNTASIILTFARLSLPSKVKAAFYCLPVRAYVPAPLRCFKCQAFGHTALRCTRDPICVCGKAPHEGSECSEPKCVNCDGNHLARSRNCPKYKEEMEINEHRIKNKCSFFEARDAIRRSRPANGVSYAQAAAKPVNNPVSPISPGDIVSLLLPQLKSLVQETLSDILSSIKNPPDPVVRLTAVPKPQRTRSPRPIPIPAPLENPVEPNIRRRSLADESPAAEAGASETSSVSSKASIGSDKIQACRQQRKDRRGWKKGRPRK